MRHKLLALITGLCLGVSSMPRVGFAGGDLGPAIALVFTAAATSVYSVGATIGFIGGKVGGGACDKKVELRRKAFDFVKYNHDAVLMDLSCGAGESLDTLADIIGLPSDQRFAKYLALQGRVADLYPDQSIPPELLADKLIDLM